MVPYMYADLKTLLQNLLQIIGKHEEIEKCKTGPQLKDLGLINGSFFFLSQKYTDGIRIWTKSEKI